MWTPEHTREWIRLMGSPEYTVASHLGVALPKMPHALLSLSVMSTGRFLHEGIFEEQTHQFRYRGKPLDITGTDERARALDLLVLRAPFPMDVLDQRIISGSRASGVVPFPGTPDDTQRYEVTTTYKLIVSTGL